MYQANTQDTLDLPNVICLLYFNKARTVPPHTPARIAKIQKTFSFANTIYTIFLDSTYMR